LPLLPLLLNALAALFASSHRGVAADSFGYDASAEQLTGKEQDAETRLD
jgi:hypothetical protein